MSDVIFIAVIVAFFALCALYVQWCDRIVGTSDPATPGAADDLADGDTPTLVASVAGTSSEVTA